MSVKQKKIFRHISIIVISCIIITDLITSFHFTFSLDESFTFSLITKKFTKLIYLDTMDVHPPFYYLLLKYYLIITTFWTKSIFVKVLIARFLTMAFFLVSLVYMKKILKYCHLEINFKFLILLVLLTPAVLNFITIIRMYQLSSLLLIVEIFNLLKFNHTSNDNNTKYMVVSVICVILNLYTFYFGGLSSEIYLALLLLIYLMKKDYIKAKKIFIGMILSIIFYLPWIPFLFIQYVYHSKTDNGGTLTILSSIKHIFSSLLQSGSIIGIIFLFTLGIAFYLSIKNSSKMFNFLLILSCINAIITLFVSLIICGSHFQTDVLYPIFTIYVLLLLSMYCCKDSKIVSTFAIVIIIILSFNVLNISYTNVKNYDIPAMTLQSNFYKWKNSNNKDIVVNKLHYPLSEQMTISEDSIYLASIHKNAIVKNYNYKRLSHGLVNNNKNTKLIKRLFKNVIIKENKR